MRALNFQGIQPQSVKDWEACGVAGGSRLPCTQAMRVLSEQQCSVCDEAGAWVPCSKSNCRRMYHLSCAQKQCKVYPGGTVHSPLTSQLFQDAGTVLVGGGRVVPETR